MTLNMNELLDITDLPGIDGESLPVYEPLELVKVNSHPDQRSIDLEKDYTSVRENFHYQQQMIMDAAKIFLESAKNADSPRHMEVFSTLMGQATTTNKELLKLHKEMKEITNEQTITKNSQGAINVDKAQIFVGSPTDLMDQLGDAHETKMKTLNE